MAIPQLSRASARDLGTRPHHTPKQSRDFWKGRVELDSNGNLTNRRYYLKDYLGSTREVISASGAYQESYDYYPFGLEMPQRATQSSGTLEQFTGKERDTEANLNLDYFGARYYDPAIGRWNGVDPLAGKNYMDSPYSYAINNPIAFIDPAGKDTLHFIDQKDNPNNKRKYTADVIHIKNGEIIGIYINGGSTFPNYPDTDDENQNTVNSGEYDYNNEYGHKGDKDAGINIVDENGDRKAPGKNKDGDEMTMTNVNVHSGVDPEDDPAGLYRHNRGSAGCPTLYPSVANIVLPNVTGTTGTIIIERIKKPFSAITNKINSTKVDNTRTRKPNAN